MCVVKVSRSGQLSLNIERRFRIVFRGSEVFRDRRPGASEGRDRPARTAILDWPAMMRRRFIGVEQVVEEVRDACVMRDEAFSIGRRRLGVGRVGGDVAVAGEEHAIEHAVLLHGGVHDVVVAAGLQPHHRDLELVCFCEQPERVLTNVSPISALLFPSGKRKRMSGEVNGSKIDAMWSSRMVK